MKTKFTEFINESTVVEQNLKIIRKYIKIITEEESKKTYGEDDYNKEDMMIRYFTMLHNWLIIETLYKDEVKLANKELNKHISLPITTDIKIIEEKFNEYYDYNSPVRFAIETFDSIQPIRELFHENRNKKKTFFDKLIRKKNGKWEL